jgi:hypothetical protein
MHPKPDMPETIFLALNRTGRDTKTPLRHLCLEQFCITLTGESVFYRQILNLPSVSVNLL